MFKIIRNPLILQYTIIITLNLNLLGVGLGLVWPSPMLVKLTNSTETVLKEPITETQGSWVVSIGFLVGGIVNFLPPMLLDSLGRRLSIIICVIPKIVGALFLLFATEVWMLLVGRALSSITDKFMFTMVPVYASEIASKEVRGALSTILQVMSSLGIVIMLSVGPFVSYVAGNILHVALVSAAFLTVPLLPESPYFLYLKGRSEESIQLLTQLRGSEMAAKEEYKGYAENSNAEVKKMDVFKQKLFWKSMGLVAIVIIGAQLVGYNGVQLYLQTILVATQTSVRPEIASVIIGLIQLTASIFTALVTDRLGRKPILCTSFLGIMLGMIGLGAFFYLTEGAEVIVGFLNYLPLLSIMMIVFCFSAGSGSINWAVSAELFDNAARTVGLSISMFLAGTSTFVLAKYFPSLISTFGPAPSFWWFAFNCFLMFLFVLLLVPETKGKSFAEIQRALGAKEHKDEEKPGARGK